MEIILAICVTALGIFGGMLVIWNGQKVYIQRHQPLHAQDKATSKTTQTEGGSVEKFCVVIRNHPAGEFTHGGPRLRRLDSPRR